MGLTIVVESELGNRLEQVEDPTNLLHHLLPSPEDTGYRCIGMVDWYGDTVFNYLQIPRFIEEWRRMALRSANSEESVLIDRIEKMARRVGEERLYLKFYGD